MNKVFVIGEVVTLPTFDFIYMGLKISIAYFTIKLDSDIYLKVFGYDEIADLIYQKIQPKQIIMIEGSLCNNSENFSIEIDYIEQQ